jgi:hypothetical protein
VKIKEKKTSNKTFGNGIRHESPSSLCILAKSSDNGDPLPAHDFPKKVFKKKVPLWFGTCDVLAKSLDFCFGQKQQWHLPISTPKFIMGVLAQAKNGNEQFWK